MKSTETKNVNFLNSVFGVAILIAFLALLVRVFFIVFYDARPLAGGDPTAFWTYAEGIVSGRGFRSAFEPWLADRPPLYSYFLAGVFLLGGKNQQAVFFAQAFLATIATGAFYFGATQILSKTGSLIAGILFAVFPSTLLFTQQILTEAIYIPVWVFLLVCLLYLKEKPEKRMLQLAVGIFLGLLALVRREAILPGGIMVGALLWIGAPRQWKSLLQRSAIVFVTAGLVIFPWLVRNYYVLGEPVLSSSGGVNFMVGNNPLANGSYSPPPQDWQARFQGMSELERDQTAWHLSLSWIRENPNDFLKLLPSKFFVLWGFSHNFVLDIGDAFLVVLCLPGIVRLLQRRNHWDVVAIVSLLPVLTTTLIGLVFVGAWRYRQLAYPGLVLLAGYGAVQLISWYLSLREGIRRRADGTQIF